MDNKLSKMNSKRKVCVRNVSVKGVQKKINIFNVHKYAIKIVSFVKLKIRVFKNRISKNEMVT